MSKAGAARPLVARTDLVSNVDRNNGCAVILDRDDAQAIGKTRFFNVNVWISTRLSERDPGEREKNHRAEQFVMQSHAVNSCLKFRTIRLMVTSRNDSRGVRGWLAGKP